MFLSTCIDCLQPSGVLLCAEAQGLLPAADTSLGEALDCFYTASLLSYTPPFLAALRIYYLVKASYLLPHCQLLRTSAAIWFFRKHMVVLWVLPCIFFLSL